MLSLWTWGQVLKMALDALQVGQPPHGKEVWMDKFLLPQGGFSCVGRAVRPLFARPDAMLFLMHQQEAHCRALWTQRGREQGSRMCSYWIASP